MVWIIEWKMFDYFIIGCILTNSLTLALYDYSDPHNQGQRNQVLESIGIFFTVVFIIEAGMKIFGMGLIIHKQSYLREAWNIIDFSIVIAGIIELSFDFLNLKSLRTIRVIRPLKSIQFIPAMRRLVVTLINSMPELLNVAVFLAFIFFLFGILGLQNNMGSLYGKCRTSPLPLNATYWPWTSDRVCTTGAGFHHCGIGEYCGFAKDHGITLA